MNERIKQIASVTKLYRANSLPSNWDEGDYIVSPMELEKFAESIVKECIESIESTIDTDCDGDSEKMGCEFAITNLIEHFGIEK
jgi:hypothetical protein